jgi:translation initiation factor 3 subunit M
MASLVQISEEDPWIASASYVATLLRASEEKNEAAEGDADKFVEAVQQAYSKEDLPRVLELFVSKFDCVFQNTDNEQDLEGFTNIMCHIVPRIEAPASTVAAEQLASALSSDPKYKPERRLQGLINLYNTVVEPTSKFYVLLKIFQFSKASGLSDIMLNVVKGSIESWITTLGLSSADQRSLFIACADSLESCTRKPKTAARESYRLRIKALKTYSSTDIDDKGLEVAANVVKEFIVSPDQFQFDIAEIPVVRALEGSAHKNIYAALRLLLDGSVKDFRAFLAGADGKSLMTSTGSSEETLLSKMMLMAMVGLFNRRSSVSFKEISEVLDLTSNNDVENLIVKAIGKKLIEAKIDQLSEEVVISKCSSRKFERAEWEGLQTDLKQWRQGIADVLTLGTDSKAALFKGLEDLESYNVSMD